MKSYLKELYMYFFIVCNVLVLQVSGVFCRMFYKFPVSSQPCSTTCTPTTKPLSVNYHFTRQCNYSCGFCFHTALTSFVLPLEEAKKGLSLLVQAGMRKINFSGGEPFIVKKGKFLGEMVKFCKDDLRMESVTIVSNGSLITRQWFEDYGQYLDILAVSCDSFNEEINKMIGRHARGKNHIEVLERVRGWCLDFGVLFKINSVITIHNHDEDMASVIESLDPVRWKVFQCLLIDGENAGEHALRRAEEMTISDVQFEEFCQRHVHLPQFVPESNAKMRNSYLILDEYMRFLDNQEGAKKPSKSLLDVGVANAMNHAGFDEAMFFKRGGKYSWSRGDMKLDW